jgi:hypothetical protein
LYPGRARLVFDSIVNAAADGKRLRANDALRRSEWSAERQENCLFRGPAAR